MFEKRLTIYPVQAVFGAKTSLFMNIVKSELVDILERVLHRYREEICNGCRVSHPGQRQHDCLNDIPEYFFRNNYKALMKRLWLADFITVIDQSLNDKKTKTFTRLNGGSKALRRLFCTISKTADASIKKLEKVIA